MMRKEGREKIRESYLGVSREQGNDEILWGQRSEIVRKILCEGSLHEDSITTSEDNVSREFYPEEKQEFRVKSEIKKFWL